MTIFVSIGEITARLRSRGSRTDNARDQLDSDVTMDENNQINAATHNIEGVLQIWNLLLYTIVYFADLARLCYADIHLFLYRT